MQAGKSYQCKKFEYFSYHRARRIDAEPIITRNKSYDYWLFLFCDRKTNRHFLYIKWNSGKYTIIFIDMAVSGDIAMFLFHIFNSIPLLKKAYSMQRSFATIEMNTQIIIIALITHITKRPCGFTPAWAFVVIAPYWKERG